MNRSTMRRMLDRGRKAGLNTTDLYRALSSRPPSVGDTTPGQSDCNGYVTQIGANGQRSYVPASGTAKDASGHTSRREKRIMPTSATTNDTPRLASTSW